MAVYLPNRSSIGPRALQVIIIIGAGIVFWRLWQSNPAKPQPETVSDESRLQQSRMIRSALRSPISTGGRRIQAGEAWARLGTAALPELSAALADPSESVRWVAAMALGRIGPDAESLIPQLKNCLDDPNPVVREYVIFAISNIKPRSVDTIPTFIPLLLDDENSVVSAAEDALIRIGPGAIEPLLKHTDNPQAAVRRGVAKTLSRIDQSDSRIVAAQRVLLTDEDHLAREHALEMLIAIDELQTHELVRAIGDENIAVASRAVAAVPYCYCQTADAWPLLEKLLSHPDDRLRRLTVLAVAAFGTAAIPAVPQLIVHTGDSRSDIRAAALVALQRTGTTQATAISAITARLADTDARVARAAGKALFVLDRESAEAAVPALIEHLEQDDEAQQISILAALEGLGPASVTAISQLMQLLTSDNSLLQHAAAKTVAAIGPAAESTIPALIEMLRSPSLNERCRTAAARALGKIGPAAQLAVPDLRRSLRPRQWESNAITHAALLSLGQVGAGDPQVGKLLRNALNSYYGPDISCGALVGLVAFDSQAPDLCSILKNSLRDGHAFLQMQAAILLADTNFECTEAHDALLAATQDRNCYVQTVAVIALRRWKTALPTEISTLQKLVNARNNGRRNHMRMEFFQDESTIMPTFVRRYSQLSLKSEAKTTLEHFQSSSEK